MMLRGYEDERMGCGWGYMVMVLLFGLIDIKIEMLSELYNAMYSMRDLLIVLSIGL